MRVKFKLPSKAERLKAISVAGFKSISREQRLSFAPLTILAGANSSGKSSMVQPLLLMKQTLESPYDPGVFLLDGPNVRFTHSDQMVSKVGDGVSSFFIKLEEYESLASIYYKKSDDFGFCVDKLVMHGSRCIEIQRNEKPSDEKSLDIIQIFSADNPSPSDVLIDSAYVGSDRFLFQFALNYKVKGDKQDVTRRITISNSSVTDAITDVIHLPGLRGNPERTYKTSGVGNKFSGTFENYVASIIKLWQQQHRDNLHSLCRHLEHIGLTSKVSATALDATQVEIKVGRLPGATDADLVNIADVGVGVSQTLPVLVALLAAEPGQIVYIEQPEIHLHPLAQYKLAAVIAEASKRGVLVVIETHSDILIRGVQTLVAKGELDPNIVKLHWFSRSPEDGSTTVTCAELDENGSFGDWPQDFDTTALLTEKAYLDAVEERLFRNAK
jgi:predicted ATPase